MKNLFTKETEPKQRIKVIDEDEGLEAQETLHCPHSHNEELYKHGV